MIVSHAQGAVIHNFAENCAAYVNQFLSEISNKNWVIFKLKLQMGAEQVGFSKCVVQD